MLLKAVLNCCRYKSSVVCFCLGSGFSDSCDYAYKLFNCLCLCVSQKQETEKLNFWIVYSCDRAQVAQTSTAICGGLTIFLAPACSRLLLKITKIQKLKLFLCHAIVNHSLDICLTIDKNRK